MHEQMITLIKLGVMLMPQDQTRSLEALNSALGFAERLAREEPRSGTCRADVAWCEDNIGATLIYAGKGNEARPHFVRSSQLRRELLAEKPGENGLRVELAGTLVNLGLVESRGEPEQAERDFAEAAELLELAHKDRPEESAFVLSLSKLMNNWGNLAAQRQKPEVGLERMTRGLSLIEPILRRHPTLSDARLSALNLHGARASILSALGRHIEAVADWDQVIALNAVPADETNYRLLRLLDLLRGGDHNRAIEEIDRVAASARGDSTPAGADLYNIACFYALASAAVKRDTALSADDRSRLADAHAANALDWLRKCVDAGFFQEKANRDHALVDTDLVSIRDRPEFGQIVKAPTD
jgi:tetratricopeptide (TPR) repeat protein